MDDLLADSRREEFNEICERYGVDRLDLFGSAAAGSFDPDESDLDFVLSFESRTPAKLFDRYFGLKEDLESLFGRGVDLLMEESMKNLYLVKSVNENRMPLYAT
jgi:predicted nucleotidyltransferase